MPDMEDYTVGWICAIKTESVAAQAFLDEKHDPPEHVAQHDNNIYTLGRMGRHNVVIAALPKGEYGMTSAATVAKDMLHSFPSIRIGLMVGIGGGAPSPASDIRLGDVVVSSRDGDYGGVFQYDFGKTIQDQAFHFTGFLDQPPTILRAAVSALEAQYEADGHQLGDHIAEVLDGRPRLRKKYSRPPVASDILYQSDFVHSLDPSTNCDEACGVDPEHIMARAERDQDEDDPVIHYGTIASGNLLMKDAQIRDTLATEKGVLCFEMEAAGLMNHFPCLVIRGICDYSDSHKNDEWQGFAAMMAAAYAKDVLRQIPPNKAIAETRISERLTSIHKDLEHIHQNLHEANTIVKIRESKDQIAEMERWLRPPDPSTNANQARKLRHDGTGTWLLDSLSFREWRSGSRQSGSCRHLWLYGLVGCGKTVLSTTILDHLDNSADDSLVLKFFFDFSDVTKQTVDGMLRSFVFQLYLNDTGSDSQLDSAFKAHESGRRQPSTGDIWGCMRELLKMREKVIIVLDALDESTTRRALLQWIKDVACAADLENVQLVFTSRPEADFRRDMPSMIGEDNCIELDKRAIDGDIKSYVVERIHKSLEFAKWAKSSTVLEQIQEAVGSKSNGMFRWAACQLDSLETCLDREGIEYALETLPRDLNETYERMLEQIAPERKHKAVRLLQFLVQAQKPMTLDEAIDIIAIRTHGSQKRFDTSDRMPDPFEITNFCPSLLTITQVQQPGQNTTKCNAVQLTHLSVREFLLRRGDQKFSGLELSINITQTCLVYLSSIQAVYEYTSSRFPFAERAATIWMDHAAQADSCEETTREVVAFLQRKSLLDLWTALHQPDLWTHEDLFETEATALYFACFKGLEKTANKLILDGANVNAQGGKYVTALKAACHQGHLRIVQLLLKNEANVNDEGEGVYRRAIEAASRQGHLDVVQLLLDNGAEINPDDSGGSDALHEASLKGHIRIVHLLLSHGVHVNGQKGLQGSALQAASSGGHLEIVRLLLNNGANVNDHGIGLDLHGSALYSASLKGHLNVVQLLLIHGADVNLRSDSAGTALQAAAAHHHLKIVQILLDNGADVNVQGGSDGTALQGAVLRGRLDTIKLLLKYEVDVDAQGGHYGNALQAASFLGLIDVARELLRKGANVNAQGGKFSTALKAAALRGNLGMIRLLLEYGADVRGKGGRHGDALDAALLRGHEEIAEVLKQQLMISQASALPIRSAKSSATGLRILGLSSKASS